MSIQISVESFSDSGKLLFTYMKKEEKKKLCRVSYYEGDKITNISLNKIWVNGFPANQIKKFYSTIIFENISFSVNTFSVNKKEVHLTIDKIKSIPLIIKWKGEKRCDLHLHVPEDLTVEGLKIALAKNMKEIPFPKEKDYKAVILETEDFRSLGSNYLISDFQFSENKRLIATDVKGECQFLKNDFRDCYEHLNFFVENHPEFQKKFHEELDRLSVRSFELTKEQFSDTEEFLDDFINLFNKFSQSLQNIKYFAEHYSLYKKEIRQLMLELCDKDFMATYRPRQVEDVYRNDFL